MTTSYIENFYDKSPSAIARAREKWSVYHRGAKYLGDNRSKYLSSVFDNTSVTAVMAYVSNLALSRLLTPGKRNRILGQGDAHEEVSDTLRCELELPTLEYTALVLLKFMQFGEPDIKSYPAIMSNSTRDILRVCSENVYDMRVAMLVPERVIKGVKILCAIAALKPELYKGLKKIYDGMDKRMLSNTLVSAKQMFTLRVTTGTVAIPLFTGPGQVDFEALEAFASKITEAAYVILDCLSGSLEDFFEALLALDIENITTYKEENTMLVVTEILKSLVNNGVLVTNNGRLMSITINADDSVNIEPYSGDSNERPLITKLMVRNGDQEEEIFSLQDSGLERIVSHAQNIINGAEEPTTRTTTECNTTAPAGARTTLAQMRRNTDGSISVRRVIGAVSMWAPATEAEAAAFLAHENAPAVHENAPVVHESTSEDFDDEDLDLDDMDLEESGSDNDIVVCAVTDNNSVRMIRLTRGEAEDQGLAILSVVERRN